MIVVFVNSMEDTDLLKQIYEGLDDIKLLVNPTYEEVDKILMDNPGEKFLAIGHGTWEGLLNVDWTGYAIDEDTAPLLRDREVIGIWCNSDWYARLNSLKGFYTGMFISNQQEAEAYNFVALEPEVFEEVSQFAKRVNGLLKQGVPLCEWVERLRSEADLKKDFVKYNYDGLRYY